MVEVLGNKMLELQKEEKVVDMDNQSSKYICLDLKHKKKINNDVVINGRWMDIMSAKKRKF